MRKLSDILQEQAERFRRFDIPSGAESFEILGDQAKALEGQNAQLLEALQQFLALSKTRGMMGGNLVKMQRKAQETITAATS